MSQITTSDAHLTAEQRKVLTKLPQDLRDMTLEQDEACVAFFAGLDMRELRQRQTFTAQQIELAFAQRNDLALTNLQVTESQLARAVALKAFGQKVLPPRAGDRPYAA